MEKLCYWWKNKNLSLYDLTCCGKTYEEDFIKKEKFRYCPFCGKLIKTIDHAVKIVG